MRVDVLGREEIEEKMLMTPGDIVMMLNEMGGLRVQATSPSLGAASVRIQGMRGRYTRFLSDGLPLFGEQPGGLGLLQIPPMDLGQVEVIKGVASALYGAGAMGGVVNLSRGGPGTSRARGAVQPIHPRRDRRGRCGCRHRSTTAGGLRCSASGHRRTRWTWTTTGGRTWRSTGAASYGRVCSGRTMRARRSSPRSASRRRIAAWRDDAGQDACGHRAAVSGSTRHDAGRWRRARPDAPRRQGYVMTAAQRRRRSSTIITSATRSSAISTTRPLARSRCAARREGHLGGGRGLRTRRLRPTDVPRFGYTFTIPGLFAQDDVDVRPVAARLGERARGLCTASTARSSVRAIRRCSRRRGGPAASRSGQRVLRSTPLTEETEAAGLTRLSRSVAARRRARAAVSRSISAARSGRVVHLHGVRVERRRSAPRRSRVDGYALRTSRSRRPIAASSCSRRSGASRSR